jgi:hypothetical protein
MRLFLLLGWLALPGLALAQTRHTVSGYVTEKGSGETLLGANVYVPGTTKGTTTNNYGFYSLTLEAADSVTLVFSFVGYRPEPRTVALRQNAQLNVELTAEQMLQEVVVTASQTEQLASQTPQMSNIEVPVQQIKKIPALLGEKDVLKVLQLMPGVQKGSEGNAGVYVRGGGPDQNLVILDDAILYNVNHLFGFFSLFNGDALKSVELTKGGFPARFGGRLSSVIEMNMKEGSKEKLHGEGGIGLISSRLTLEGPLTKNKKMSFLASGRRTYADALVRPFIGGGRDGGYYFYDLNAKLNYDFGRKDKLYLSGYFGLDKFFARVREDNALNRGAIDWGNRTATLRWNHLFNDKLFANTSLIYSNYQFQITSLQQENGDEFNLRYLSNIRDLGAKIDFDYFPSPQHAIKMGATTTYHQFKPSAIVVRNTDLGEDRQEVDRINVLESGVYVEDTWKPLPRLRLNGGLRISHFLLASGRSYLRPEPRLAVAYNLRNDLALKASYARMNQYVHLLSNTGIGLPTDLWVPTTDRIAPQQSWQVAAGLAKDFVNQGLTLTVEGYYKKMDNLIGYREGASFLLIEDPDRADRIGWEDNVTAGQGWSYGAEVLLQKKVGRLSGWVGYTLSWSQLQFPELNFGNRFFARYDRRHDISVVGIYELSPRITLSATWVYGTGNAITLPQANVPARLHEALPIGLPPTNNFGFFGVTGLTNTTDFGSRNDFRMAAYHRLDLAVQFHRKMRKGHERTWEFGLYNAYSRLNPFFYYIGENDARTEQALRQISLFPIIPSFSYNFKF